MASSSIISGGSQEWCLEAQEQAVCKQRRQQFQQLVPRLPQPGLWQRQQHQHRDQLHHHGREHPGTWHHHTATVVRVGHQQADEPLSSYVGQGRGRKWKCKSSHTPTPRGPVCVCLVTKRLFVRRAVCFHIFKLFSLSPILTWTATLKYCGLLGKCSTLV